MFNSAKIFFIQAKHIQIYKHITLKKYKIKLSPIFEIVMSNQQEKLLFSHRLKQALNESNHPISPTFLANEFNNRYSGQPISVQSANNWLLGKAIPNQDKLALLAIWLKVSSQWLRFGDSSSISNISDVIDSTDLDYFIKFKSLKINQKRIIKDLIDEFYLP